MSFYEIMGLQKDATQSDIEKKYKVLAIQLHPDKAASFVREGLPGVHESDKLFKAELEKLKKVLEESFQKLQEAYSILSDPEKRKYYDTHGTVDNKPNHETLVRELFINLFKESIVKTTSPETEDIVKKMLNSVDHEIAHMKTEKVRILKIGRKIAIIKKRLSGPDKGIHTVVFKADLKDVRNSLRGIKNTSKLMADVRVMVEEYSYSVNEMDNDFVINSFIRNRNELFQRPIGGFDRFGVT